VYHVILLGDELKLLTPKQVGKELAVSRSTVLRLVADGTLPAVCLRRGKRKAVYRIRQEQLDKWIIAREREGQRKPPQPPVISGSKAAEIKPTNGVAPDYGTSAL